MKLAYLLILVAVSGCGSSDGGKADDDSDNGTLNGTNLAALPLFEGACTGTANADFSTSDENFGSIDASFSAGDRLVLESLQTFDDGKYWSVNRSDAGLTGVNGQQVPADKLDVACDGYEYGIAVMSDVELFTDEQRTASACTLKAGQTFHGTSLKGIGSVLADDGYDGTVTLPVLAGTTCPADVDLNFHMAAITHTSGNKSKTESFFPIFTLFYPSGE